MFRPACLDGAWGDVAYTVAVSAQDGIMELVARGAAQRRQILSPAAIGHRRPCGRKVATPPPIVTLSLT